MNQNQIGIWILRLGMAAVYFYFGFSQLFDGVSWVGMVPVWATNLLHIPPAMIILGNGLLEVVLGILLVLGLWTRWVAIILAAHLLVIASEFGFSPIGARDFGLSMATLSLAFLGREEKKIV